mmetsp:Transcript_2109/g.6204  ORF Transcript_2109/g.6204 Transcript_2109/m.6204 type:complete len:205 (+) Transcript_2109:470-1084(+)
MKGMPTCGREVEELAPLVILVSTSTSRPVRRIGVSTSTSTGTADRTRTGTSTGTSTGALSGCRAAAAEQEAARAPTPAATPTATGEAAEAEDVGDAEELQVVGLIGQASARAEVDEGFVVPTSCISMPSMLTLRVSGAWRGRKSGKLGSSLGTGSAGRTCSSGTSKEPTYSQVGPKFASTPLPSGSTPLSTFTAHSCTAGGNEQ